MTRFASIIHLTYREGLSSVFLSQVARPMSLVNQQGCPVTLAVCSPIGEYLRKGLRRLWCERRNLIERKFGLIVKTFPSPPARARNLWDETRLLRAWLKHRLLFSDKVILHCRGYEAANMAFRAVGDNSRFRIIFDCRGLNAAEFLYINGYQSMQKAPVEVQQNAYEIGILEQHAAQRCHAMLCVSEVMKRYVVSEWMMPPEKISVIPCCTDVKAGLQASVRRNEIRKKLGLENKFVVSYCGSLREWQMPKESLAIFRIIADLRSDAHFLAITTQPDRMKQVADEYNINRNQITVISVPQAEVSTYLGGADVGLLIRDESLVNRVASPVKFAEYLSCRLPVIMSNNIGDYSALLEKEGIGILISLSESNKEISSTIKKYLMGALNNSEGLRNHCQKVALRELDYSRYLISITKFYQILMNG